MKDILKKRSLIVVFIIILVLIIAISLVFGFTNHNRPSNEDNKTESLNTILTNLGKKFYEENYYSRLDNKDKLADFQESGLNVSITNLEVILPLDEEIKRSLDDRKCNLDNTKIVIYPREPYGIKDYNIKVELVCEK